jgi:hypothetical protein
MLAGDSGRRTFDGSFNNQGISFACLGANQTETNRMPNYNCPGGLRAHVFFPSCWDGKNLDSPDHSSHMSYPASGHYNNGPCPATHPVQLISLFFEVLYDTNRFKDMWYGGNGGNTSHPFVFSNGDPTGYGYHGDFLNGWDVSVLQRVISECNDPAAQGVLEKCAAISTFTGAQQSVCRLPQQINEKVTGFLTALPGCNPVTPGPARPPKNATCPGLPVATIGNPATYYTNITAKGWGYQGCASDGSPRTLANKTSMSVAGSADKMTAEFCADFCKDYTYFGLVCFCLLLAPSIPPPANPKKTDDV